MRQWFTMKAEDKTAEIVIYDEIGASWWGEETVSAKQFITDLAALGDVDSIALRINWRSAERSSRATSTACPLSSSRSGRRPAR